MNKETIDFYNSQADQYIEFSSAVGLEKQHKCFLSKISKKNASILDLGFGGGRDSLYFQNKGFDVTSLDACEAFVEHGKKIGLKKVILGDIEGLCFVDAFDGIWANASLLHISREKLPEVFRRIYGALKPQGVFYCSFKTGSFQGMRDGRYYTDLTKDDLMNLYQHSEFSSIEVEFDKDSLNRECVWLECYLTK